jgi:hypothetical protein
LATKRRKNDVGDATYLDPQQHFGSGWQLLLCSRGQCYGFEIPIGNVDSKCSNLFTKNLVKRIILM